MAMPWLLQTLRFLSLVFEIPRRVITAGDRRSAPGRAA
jgi:hypothetical protein